MAHVREVLQYRGYVSNASESRHEVLLGCIPVRLAKTQQNDCKAWSQIYEDDAPLTHTSAVIGVERLVPAVLKRFLLAQWSRAPGDNKHRAYDKHRQQVL